MKVYHYARVDEWENIQRGGSWAGADEPGLIGLSRIGQVNPDAFDTTAIFCFTEPLPKEWMNNPHFQEIWAQLKKHAGKLLLEIEIDESTEAFVIDRGHMEGFFYVSKEGLPEKYLFPTREEAEREYIKSKISLKEYMERKDELNFSLPEVIITKHVPLPQIKISDRQPLLEEELLFLKKDGRIRNRLIEKINSIPELAEWYKKYQEASQEVNQSFGPKIF